MTVDDILEQAKTLSPQERRELATRLLQLAPEAADEAWTDEELQSLLTIEPMTGKEIVEAGLTGGWHDLGIQDGAEWVEEQRRQW